MLLLNCRIFPYIPSFLPTLIQPQKFLLFHFWVCLFLCSHDVQKDLVYCRRVLKPREPCAGKWSWLCVLWLFCSCRCSLSVQREHQQRVGDTAPGPWGEGEIRAHCQVHRQRGAPGNAGGGALPGERVGWRWLSSFPSQWHRYCRCCRGVQQEGGNAGDTLFYLVPEVWALQWEAELLGYTMFCLDNGSWQWGHHHTTLCRSVIVKCCL